MADVFTQYQVPFTVLKPHVVYPLSDAFRQNLRELDWSDEIFDAAAHMVAETAIYRPGKEMHEKYMRISEREN